MKKIPQTENKEKKIEQLTSQKLIFLRKSKASL